MATPSPEDLEAFLHMNDRSRHSRVGLILAIEIPVVIIMVAVVCLRFYARTFIRRTLGKDDWIMACSAVIAFVNTVVNCATTKFGAGVHAWNANQSHILIASKLGWVYQVLFTPAVTLCKMSIVLTYLRIFPARKDRIFCFTALVYLALYGVIVTLIIALQCSPVKAYWDLSVKVKKCLNQKAAMMVVSALNSLSDLAVFLWPAPNLWDIQLPVKKRISLIFMFSLGVIVCICGIIRISYYPTFFGSKDVFWEGAVLSIVSNLECNVSIICGSLPELRPFFSRYFHKTTTTTSRNITAYHPSDKPQTSSSRKNSPHVPNRDQRDVKALSSDSLSKFYQWTGAQDSSAYINEAEVVALQDVSVKNHSQRFREDWHSATSEADGSHGSEEMWVSGGDGKHANKYIPGTAI